MSPTHYWGDGFNFEMLEEAMRYIRDKCREQGFKVKMKEKYGTIRYEYLFLWGHPDNSVRADSPNICMTAEQWVFFFDTVVEATEKYKEVAPEIASDTKYILNRSGRELVKEQLAHLNKITQSKEEEDDWDVTIGDGLDED